MSKKITRREFIKDSLFATIGAAAVCSVGSFDLFGASAAEPATADLTSLSIIRELSKCIGCGRCVEVCSGTQGLDILEMAQNGSGKSVSSLKYGSCLSETKCIGCGQCARACPSGAISIRNDITKVSEALKDRSKYIVWQFAPSAQHIIGEEFRILSGEDVSGKIATAARLLGGVAYRTDFGADITIMEEAAEFLECYEKGIKRPFMTSCCPGWVNYVELNYPELIPHLSSCKSPMEMLGALIKDYLPRKHGVNAADIFHIAVMPCTAKKYEAARNEMTVNGIRAVDAVITVPEFKNLLVANGINIADCPDGDFDALFDGTSGGARIFGASGGVCESAMRTVYYSMTGTQAAPDLFAGLRENKAVKEAEIAVNGKIIKACVVNGIGNIKGIVESILAGRCDYDFIEVMACSGGCSGGGGTPLLFGETGVRRRGIYKYDASNKIYASHNNETLAEIYTDYLEKPCSNKSEELLHTIYSERK